MSNHSHLDRRQIAEQAAHWLLTLQDGDMSTAQRTAFVDWLRQSPVHIAELLRISQVERDLSNFKGWKELFAAQEADASNIVPLRLPVTATKMRPMSRHRYRFVGIAATLLMMVATLGWWHSAGRGQIELETMAGERREVTLSDGSAVDLSPSSAVVVRYERDRRLVMLERGQARFHVAKNPHRPFIVQVDRTRVRAVGTVFNVERSGSGVSVTVVEGRVAVSQLPKSQRLDTRTPASALVVSLSENEQVSINTGGVASAVHKFNERADTDRAELTFDNETVAGVSRRFNLYNKVQIDVVDPVLAARRMSGVFRADDPQSFVSFIEVVAEAPVSRPQANRIVVGLPQNNR